MTEYELIDALNSTVELMINTFSAYVGATSAYLVCAYLAGARLTRSQCSVISTLYVVSALVGVLALFAMGSSAGELAYQLSQLNPGKSYGMQSLVRNALTVVCAGGIPACLKFMWDVRKPRENVTPAGTLHSAE
jgi:hypothetical protein